MTPKSTIAVLLLFLFTACDGITIDNHEHFMEDVCKCEEFGPLTENLYITDKEGWVQPCARTINGMLKWGYVIDSDTCHTYLPAAFRM